MMPSKSWRWPGTGSSGCGRKHHRIHVPFVETMYQQRLPLCVISEACDLCREMLALCAAGSNRLSCLAICPCGARSGGSAAAWDTCMLTGRFRVLGSTRGLKVAAVLHGHAAGCRDLGNPTLSKPAQPGLSFHLDCLSTITVA